LIIICWLNHKMWTKQVIKSAPVPWPPLRNWAVTGPRTAGVPQVARHHSWVGTKVQATAGFGVPAVNKVKTEFSTSDMAWQNLKIHLFQMFQVKQKHKLHKFLILT
jgi:hypothetical protein